MEAPRPDRIDIEVRQLQDSGEMPVNRLVVRPDISELIPCRARDAACRRVAHSRPFRPGQKQPGGADELERVPLDRVVARGDREAARRVMCLYRELNGRRWREPNIDHVAPHRLQGSDDGAVKHRTRHAAVATDDDGRTPAVRLGRCGSLRGGPCAKPGRVGGHHLWRESFADPSPYAGDTDHEPVRHGMPPRKRPRSPVRFRRGKIVPSG